VTGGADKIVRLWNPGVINKPTARLVGHRFSIVDVAVNEEDQHVISVSSSMVVRVWDVHTLNSLQVEDHR